TSCKMSAEVVHSQQLANEEKWKELTQYFGINDRFESPVDSKAPQKSGLELSIEKSVAEGDIDKAEELSDRLAIREVSGLLTKALRKHLVLNICTRGVITKITLKIVWGLKKGRDLASFEHAHIRTDILRLVCQCFFTVYSSDQELIAGSILKKNGNRWM
uniref:Family with sequence similarity 204 member A n=1 Tax=Bubo bubo TaxID=30461 RepID=A0A8C0FJ75_BUBBB